MNTIPATMRTIAPVKATDCTTVTIAYNQAVTMASLVSPGALQFNL